MMEPEISQGNSVILVSSAPSAVSTRYDGRIDHRQRKLNNCKPLEDRGKYMPRNRHAVTSEKTKHRVSSNPKQQA